MAGGIHGMFARGFGTDGTEGLYARGFGVAASGGGGGGGNTSVTRLGSSFIKIGTNYITDSSRTIVRRY